MTTRVDILGLIADRRARRPVRTLLALDALFNRLAACGGPDEALRTEDRIWDAWMHHPHRAAAEALELATRDIAARRYDIAETRLSALLRSAPDFAEAWHKRAALYYLLGRGAADEARFAFYAALCVHPHLPRARQALFDKP